MRCKDCEYSSIAYNATKDGVAELRCNKTPREDNVVYWAFDHDVLCINDKYAHNRGIDEVEIYACQQKRVPDWCPVGKSGEKAR